MFSARRTNDKISIGKIVLPDVTFSVLPGHIFRLFLNYNESGVFG